MMNQKIRHPLFTNSTLEKRLSWLDNPDICPYVFVRPENKIEQPGRAHPNMDWFPHKVLYKNPLEMKELAFANRILRLEAKAFSSSGMAMPRWVFYDCAIVPGFVAGFAARTASLAPEVRRILEVEGKEAVDEEEWTPLSLFIIIPTMSDKGEWVAHNLCSVNSILPKDLSFYGIGFISKAFGLWYANVASVCGITQWTSPAVRLHAHYGDFEILTAFTPVHSYSHTLTYRVQVETSIWSQFFEKKETRNFNHQYQYAGFDVNPREESSLISFQQKLELGQGPFFIEAAETIAKEIGSPLKVYQK